MKIERIKIERYSVWIVAVVAIITFIPFLGETLFNTKGEPREAIVAVSMLQQGDWILPESCGGDIPYKPPFFAWCVAALSMLSGGEVTEFTSRLPSALAMIVIVMTGFVFFKRRTEPLIALIMALVTMTAFEVHRAAYACRVDMVLTMFIVTSLYALYRHHERGAKGISWLAVLLMSGGVLTKGPVAMGLPCLVIGVYRLLKGDGFWRVFTHLAVSGLLACVLPAMWYVAAYNQGGDEFLRLVLEENVGRLTGTMSYDSHVNPWYYNVITVVAGLAPYTLLLIMALFGLSWKLCRQRRGFGLKAEASRILSQLRQMRPERLFSMLSVILIFVFYCIPKSKRSVYLLPIYPFLAYFITLAILWLVQRKSCALKIYAWFISVASLMVMITFILIKSGVVPIGTFGLKNAMFIEGLQCVKLSVAVIVMLLVLLVLAVKAIMACMEDNHIKITLLTLAATVVLYWNFSAYLQPAVLNAKSDYQLAQIIGGIEPSENVYGFIDDPFLRFYTINFYLGDKVKMFEKEQPSKGYLIVGEKDKELLLERYSSRYEFTQIFRSDKKGCDHRQFLLLLRFEIKN